MKFNPANGRSSNTIDLSGQKSNYLAKDNPLPDVRPTRFKKDDRTDLPQRSNSALKDDQSNFTTTTFWDKGQKLDPGSNPIVDQENHALGAGQKFQKEDPSAFANRYNNAFDQMINEINKKMGGN